MIQFKIMKKGVKDEFWAVLFWKIISPLNVIFFHTFYAFSTLYFSPYAWFYYKHIGRWRYEIRNEETTILSRFSVIKMNLLYHMLFYAWSHVTSSKTERFCKKMLTALIIFTKSSIADVQLGSKYVSAIINFDKRTT